MNRRSFLAAVTAAFASRGLARAQVTSSDPLRAAENISQLESHSYIPQFYSYYATMHPDARAIIPRRAVHAWYNTNFWPRGPRPAVATGVNWLSTWTWGVTGQQYSNVAEVSYTQYFDDGSVDNDVVRLIQQNGQWHWWFGRSPEFVQEWDDRTNQMLWVPQQGEAPYGLSTVTTLDENALERLPERIRDEQTDARYVRDEISPADPANSSNGEYTAVKHVSFNPEPFKEFSSAYITLYRFNGPGTAADQVRKVFNREQDYPFATIKGWNTAPAAGLPWVDVYSLGFDVVGELFSTILVSDQFALQINAYSSEVISAVCKGIANPRPVH